MRKPTASPRSRLTRGAFAATAIVVLAACGAGDEAVSAEWDTSLSPAARPASSGGCATRINNTSEKLRECVTVDGVRAHQAALQEIADDNGGTRASGTPGYAASVSYVVAKMSAAGYIVTLHSFPFVYKPLPTLQQLTPVAATYPTGSFTGTGFGEVTAAVTPVDINLVLPRANTSGCEASDFAGFPVGNIALLQRGTCDFSDKALNAQAAGASAVIIFNQGNAPEREGLIIGTLGADTVVDIPVVGASFADGVSLTQPGSTALVDVPQFQNVTQYNVIAESRGGDPGNVVMVGAHLDSAQQGPGIQSNGSGSAAILETALQMATVTPVNKVRFAWWGGYESGIVGSTAYVEGLSTAEHDKIALYLDFNMLASPNYVFFVYDADDSAPTGSTAIEDVFEAYYTQRALPFKGYGVGTAGDLASFSAENIPVGALTTGAGGIKTAAEAALWGGTAGAPYDPCYRQACDTFDNVNLEALGINADAVAHATLLFAMSTQSVNGKRGRGNLGRPGPGATTVSTSALPVR